LAALPATSWGQANTCNGLVTIDYVTGPNFAVPGDVLRVRLTLGTGSINGGTSLTINVLRFDLDCNSNFALGLPCTDEGAFVQYEGDSTISNTCGKTFTTGHAVGTAPNEVVFTPNTPIVIPANSSVPPGFCNIEFDIRVMAQPSVDATPTFIEEVGGYRNTDAMCNNGVLASGGSQSSAIPLCPVCNDGQECTTDACNQTSGQCVFTNVQDSTPCTDNDNNLCTFAGCEAGQCVQAHQTTPCPPDANDCTNDPACNPLNGLCEKPPVQDSTPCPDTDQNLCTTAGCEAGNCVQAHQTTPCPPDANPCTNDPACNPANGLCEKPPVQDSTPCPDTDNNLCTTAGCEAGQCVQPHQTTPCPPDSNSCTNDPPCNPTNGLCEKPPVQDSTPCADTDADQCTAAGCEAGQCVQDHVDVCPDPINHVQCYEVKPASFPVMTVTAQDALSPGPLTLTLRFPHRLCAPVQKNNEAILDPTEHLTGYKAKGAFAKVLNQTIQNQFGTLQLDIVRPDLFKVPTAKNGVPLTPPPGDHFTCYKVKRSRGAAKFAPRVVTAADQFQSVTETVVKPIRLCAPANKNNEDPTAPLHPDYLLCYKTTKASLKFGQIDVTADNQFGPDQLRLIHRRELCVPSLRNPGSTTTTTAVPTTTTAAPTTTTIVVPTTTTTSSSSTSSSTSTTQVVTTTTVTTTTVGSPSGAFVDQAS
jgi:hypothetical protein